MTDTPTISRKRYKTLRHEEPRILDDLVEQHLNEGWDLYDSPFAVDGPVDGTIYCQAVTRNLYLSYEMVTEEAAVAGEWQ